MFLFQKSNQKINNYNFYISQKHKRYNKYIFELSMLLLFLKQKISMKELILLIELNHNYYKIFDKYYRKIINFQILDYWVPGFFENANRWAPIFFIENKWKWKIPILLILINYYNNLQNKFLYNRRVS
jgi:hypothetical protein